MWRKDVFRKKGILLSFYLLLSFSVSLSLPLLKFSNRATIRKGFLNISLKTGFCFRSSPVSQNDDIRAIHQPTILRFIEDLD